MKVADKRLSLPQTGIRNARSINGPHTTKQHQAAESKDYHGQTTTLWNDREGTSLARRGTPDCAVSARQVHAGHSSRDDARRCDDVPYFLWDHDPCTHGLASVLAHHPSRRTGRFASGLAAADIGGSALAALCACACDHDDGLDLCIRAWLVDLAVLCGPSADVADRKLAARKFSREMARHHGMGAAPGDRRPRGGRHGAHVYFPRPDHAADAAGEADDCSHREPEAAGRDDEARSGSTVRLMIRVNESPTRRATSGRRQSLRARSFGRLFGLSQTMFQFLDQLRKPHRSRGIGCCPRQSAALFELPFELFSVALLVHHGTLLFMRPRPTTETTCRLNIFPRLSPGIACDLVIWITEPDEQRKKAFAADLQSDFHRHRNLIGGRGCDTGLVIICLAAPGIAKGPSRARQARHHGADRS